MVRISDALMSGTAFGTMVFRVAPEAAVGGPLAVVYDSEHGGTYNAHPVNMAATVATLTEIKQGLDYATIEKQGRRLMDGISDILRRHTIPARVQGFARIFHVAFGDAEPIETYRDTFALDRVRYVRFTAVLLERGVRALEGGAWFLSSVHDDGVIDRTLEAIESAAQFIRDTRREGASHV
jgi:glutamate-1-semialdehyde 2,1-aminomutase